MSTASVHRQPGKRRCGRILQISADRNEEIIELCRGLHELGWEVTLVHGGPRAGSTLWREIAFPDWNEDASGRRERPVSRRIVELLGEGFRIVHTHGTRGGIVGRREGMGSGCRLVHSPGRIGDGVRGFRARRLRTQERKLNRISDRLVVPSDFQRDRLLESGLGGLEQMVTIPRGVDLSAMRERMPSRRTARHALSIRRRSLVVGYRGSFDRKSGIEQLVDAASRLRSRLDDLHLLLAGDGPERADWGRRIRRSPLAAQVSFAAEDPRAALAAMDLFVVPTTDEAARGPVIEALAAGLPVIAMASRAMSEVLGAGNAGLLVSGTDGAALAPAIEGLARDPERRKRLADRARFQAERYDAPTVLASLHNLYSKLLVS